MLIYYSKLGIVYKLENSRV